LQFLVDIVDVVLDILDATLPFFGFTNQIVASVECTLDFASAIDAFGCGFGDFLLEVLEVLSLFLLAVDVRTANALAFIKQLFQPPLGDVRWFLTALLALAEQFDGVRKCIFAVGDWPSTREGDSCVFTRVL